MFLTILFSGSPKETGNACTKNSSKFPFFDIGSLSTEPNALFSGVGWNKT